jgi:hypothetical protein
LTKGQQQLLGAAAFASAELSQRQWKAIRKVVPAVPSYYSAMKQLRLLAPTAKHVVVAGVSHVAVSMTDFIAHDLACNPKFRESTAKVSASTCQ